jgi:hypothetical protein
VLYWFHQVREWPSKGEARMDLTENAVGKIDKSDLNVTIRKSILADWIEHVEQGNKNGMDASKLDAWKAELAKY